MINDFVVGDKVVLDVNSQYYNQSEGYPGVIKSLGEDHWVGVTWENGFHDMYPLRDLILFTEEEGSIIKIVPSQVVIINKQTMVTLPTVRQIRRILEENTINSETSIDFGMKHFYSLNTKLIQRYAVSDIEEITEGFIGIKVYKSNGIYYTVTNSDSTRALDELVTKGNSIKLIGEFTEKMFLQMLSFCNN